MLGDAGRVEGSQPHFVGAACALDPKEMVTSVEPPLRMHIAVEHWNGKLVEARHTDALSIVISRTLESQRRGTQSWEGS